MYTPEYEYAISIIAALVNRLGGSVDLSTAELCDPTEVIITTTPAGITVSTGPQHV